jgi:ketosteroid isomerase-like protein
MDAHQAAERWVHTWTAAWATRDADAIVALQADEGVHWASPFREPYQGREGLRRYLESSFGSETEPTRAQFARPTVDGDTASFEYWALATYDGVPTTISGCTVVRFDADGLVAEARDYSWMEEGHHPVPFRVARYP